MPSKLLEQPLLHFVVIGAAAFFVYELVAPEPASQRIVVTSERVAAMEKDFESLHGHPPSDAETAQLIDGYVRDEALHREARSLGLDEGDVVVRRRLVQNMRFLSEPALDESSVTAAEIDAHLAKTAESSADAKLVSMTHAFFARDRERAKRALDGAEDPSALGEPFLAGYSHRGVGRQRLDAQFGDGFFDQVVELEQGAWQGPVESRHGFHLVRLESVMNRESESAIEQERRARREIAEERRAQAREENIDSIVDRYEVEIEGKAP